MEEMRIEIKPIKTKKDYEQTLKLIDKLWDYPPKSKEEGILEVLSILVEEYENKHYPIGPPDPIEAIKYRMEQMHLSQSDMAVYFGSKSRVSEVLNRKRPLTLKMIKALYQQLNIPATILLAS
jgi:HTH-type transcriptional regulator/antitoxin HigA